ncbi:hypothetical protein J6590_096806, partial [Homalodisca vitripennis]
QTVMAASWCVLTSSVLSVCVALAVVVRSKEHYIARLTKATLQLTITQVGLVELIW